MAVLRYWRKPGGYTVVTNRFDAPIMNEGRVVDPFGQHERHSFTCIHCNAVTFLEAGFDPSSIGRCTCCDDFICDRCARKGGCLHIEKRLELHEKGILSTLNRDPL